MRPARNSGAVRRTAPARVFAALGDPTRLTLLARLRDGAPCSIARLTDGTRLTRQSVTKHLRILEKAGLVRGGQNGRENRFVYQPGPIEDVKKYLEGISVQWDDTLSRLRVFVE